jgi:hypothetical protein
VSDIGDVAIGDDGNASLHVHVVLGLSNGMTRGGHLLGGTVTAYPRGGVDRHTFPLYDGKSTLTSDRFGSR